MATSRLLACLHDFQSRFDSFERNRVSVRKIYDDTQQAWSRWREFQGSLSRRNSSPKSNDSTAVDVDQRPSDDSSEAPVAQMANVIRLLDEKPTLVFVGQLKSGKSTLANLVLQHHILPSDEGPCTARMVKLKFSEEWKGEQTGEGKAYMQRLKADGTRMGEPKELETVVDSRGIRRLLIPQDVVSVGRATGFGERSRESEHGAWVEIYYPHPLLKYIQVVDSPGKGENEHLDQLVNNAVSHGLVQTLVYVIDGCRGLTTKDKIDLRWIKNQLREDSGGKGRILFVCTRIDKALREETDEPPPNFMPDELPDRSDDEDNSDIEQDTDDDEGNDSNAAVTDEEHYRSLQYSTKIHERVFESLVSDEFLTDNQDVSHDQCPLFHAVSAYAANRVSESENENLFVRDFLRFEKCLAEILVENLNVHVEDALEELISRQLMLIETMFQFKFSHARKAVAAQRQLQFIIKIEEKVYQQLKMMTAGNRLSQLQATIKEEKDVCLETLPQKAGIAGVIVDERETNVAERDMQIANQVREFVCDKFNERFCKRVRDRMPVLNVTETVERCAKSMQNNVRDDLQAVRIVSTIIQAAYTPVSKAAKVKKGLPFRLTLRDFFSSRNKDPKAKYTKEWKETIARNFLESLDPKQLATAYCKEVEDTLEKAHSEFGSSMKELEAAKQEIVEDARGQQRQIRISDGYDIAEVFLKSKSFLDSLRYGIPEKGDFIGKGPTSTVYKCKGGSWGPSNVVLKARKPWPPPVSREVWPASLYFSIECLDNKNVQKAIGFLFPPKEPDDESEIWVLEESCLCSVEDALQRTSSLAFQLSGLSWLNIAKDVVNGLLHLFCQGIPHHNIKPSNVLLSHSREARLCDMGMYDIASMKDDNITRAVYFVAPELVLKTEGVATTDVYSTGILLWYLFKAHSTQTDPTPVQDPQNYNVCGNSALASVFFDMVCDPDIQLRPELNEWSNPGHELREAAVLMEKCWRQDSSERIDCTRLNDEIQKLAEELKQ